MASTFDHWDGIIIGAAVGAVVFLLVQKWFDESPWGGGEPNQTAVPSANAKNGVLLVEVPPATSALAAPVAQNEPTTEAAYNQSYYGPYEPAFGINSNRPGGQEGPEPILTQ